MPSPFFSIVIPTYNRGYLIANTLSSVITQSYTNWELILIDDGSTDNTKEVVLKFNDSRIKYNWQTNTERSKARNNGINLSSGEFICFLDSDDLWRPNHLQVLKQCIDMNGLKPALYFTGMTWNFKDHKQDVIFPSPTEKNPVEYVITNQIAPSTVCVHQSILKKETFNPALRINEDVELFARIAADYPIIQIQDVTVDFIIHNQNTKALEKNLILPQIEALNQIFSNPVLKHKISAAFKTEKLRDLKHALINYYLQIGDFPKMNSVIIRFLFSYPFHFQNKSKIVLLLYHLPGGKLLQNLIAKLK